MQLTQSSLADAGTRRSEPSPPLCAQLEDSEQEKEEGGIGEVQERGCFLDPLSPFAAIESPDFIKKSGHLRSLPASNGSWDGQQQAAVSTPPGLSLRDLSQKAASPKHHHTIVVRGQQMDARPVLPFPTHVYAAQSDVTLATSNCQCVWFDKVPAT